MEAALRTANDWLTGKDNTDIDFTAVRGTQGLKQATVNINGSDIKVAVASGAAAAKCVMDRMKDGNPDGWAFVEIMAARRLRKRRRSADSAAVCKRYC